VTHDMRLAEKLADKVIFLHEGKVAFYGPVEEMPKAENPIVRQFLELDTLDVARLRVEGAGGEQRPAAT